MRRLPTMLASASAAALTTLAVTVAVPAIADDPGGAKGPGELATCLHAHGLPGAPAGADLKPWLGARLGRGDGVAQRAMAECAPAPTIVKPVAGPSEQQLRSCLSSHGVTLPGGDGRALKDWLLEHGDDAANRDAMKACHFAPPRKVTEAGPCAAKPGEAGPAAGESRAGKPAPE
jgi:hypothetical protein